MTRDTELYALVCVLSLLSVLGTTGNLVVLYVFSRPTRHDRTGASAICPSASAKVYIMALAVADLITCSLDIPSTVYMEWSRARNNTNNESTAESPKVYMEWVDFRTRCDVFCKFYQVR